MNPHLRYSAAEYDQRPDRRGVNPISSIDAEIITAIMLICDKQKLGKLSQVLSKWKDISDNKVLDELILVEEILDLDNGFDSEAQEQDPDKKPSKTLITFGEHLLNKAQIIQVSKDSKLDGSTIWYGILINKNLDPGAMSQLSYVDWWFLDEDDRDNNHNQLCRKLINANVKIL